MNTGFAGSWINVVGGGGVLQVEKSQDKGMKNANAFITD